MSHIDDLAKSLSALPHDDRIALINKIAEGLGSPAGLHAAASPPTSLRMRKLNASMANNDVCLRNTVAELRRLNVKFTPEDGVDIASLQAATAKWSPEERIRIKSGLANVGLMD